MVYYKHLFKMRDEIPDSDGIVYSYLIYKTLDNPDFFGRENGKLDIKAVRSFLNSSFLDGHPESLEFDIDKINKSKVAKETGLARATVYNIIDRLTKKGIISKRFISCPMELFDDGYMEIPPDTKLTGQQLVFYAFLKDRARGHHSTVDTWAYRLAELFNTSEDNIGFLLSTLKKAGYIEKTGSKKWRIK